MTKNKVKYIKIILTLAVAVLILMLAIFLYSGFYKYLERVPKTGLENKINTEKEIGLNGTNSIVQTGSSISEIQITENSTDYDKDRKIVEDTKYIRIKLSDSFEKNKTYPESISDFLASKNIENQTFNYRRDETGKMYKLSVKLNTKEGLVVLGNLANDNKENQNIVSFSDLSVVLSEKSGNFFYMPAK